ncbi:uncharacterized protein LOC123209323 isoform X2 [Mangifera indica]|uniref:uncharacterized protein LOC123209323 isoform X2 n=1 Tax=Mangifera indica TaxID=29780 RepID=UPI001CFAF3CC|nr:uncharacterized protein LOC123209323 isoform X2 [Mangifera indica]
MESGVKSALKSLKERGLGNFLRDLKEVGFLNVLLDGNILQTKIHNIGATLVGIDKFGNKYYEKYGDTQYGAVITPFRSQSEHDKVVIACICIFCILNLLLLFSRKTQVGRICREESLQCISGATRMARLAPPHN